MKRFVSLLLALILCCTACILFGCTEDDPNPPATTPGTTAPVTEEPKPTPDPDTPGYLYRVENGEAAITGYEGDATELILPVWAGGVYVAAIDEFAFASRYDITSVVIPSSVKTVGEYAFYNCRGLTNVSFADGVDVVIGEGAFSNCYALTTVDLPDTLVKIDAYAFEHCTGLASISLPASLKTIGELAFGSSGLTAVTVGSGVTAMAKGVFYDCKVLESASVLANISELPAATFTGCIALRSVTLSETMEVINAAFVHCEALESVSFPGAVSVIADSCFHACMALKSVTFEKNALTTIGSFAFHYTPALTDIYFAGPEEDWQKVAINVYNEHLLELPEIHYGTSSRIESNAIDETRTVADLSTLGVGDTFAFGNYNKTSLEWLVLDKQDGRLLVILNTLIGTRKMMEELGGESCWGDSSLHAWMQNTLYAKAFNKNEKAHVCLTHITKATPYEIDTDDYLFALSYEEAERYFADDAARSFSERWWLREVAKESTHGNGYYGVVFPNGSISLEGYERTAGCEPRCAMWITVSGN